MDKHHYTLPLCITADRQEALASGSLWSGLPVAAGELTPPLNLLLQIVNRDSISNLMKISGHLIYPEFENAEGISPLMLAAGRGNAEAVAALASHPLVNLDRQNAAGLTALHLAALGGHADCVSLLLQRKANDNLLDAKGMRAADIAANEETSMAFANKSTVVHRKAARNDAAKVFEKPDAAASSQPQAPIDFSDTDALVNDIMRQLNTSQPLKLPQDYAAAGSSVQTIFQKVAAEKAGDGNTPAIVKAMKFMVTLDRYNLQAGIENILKPDITSREDFAQAYKKYGNKVVPTFWNGIFVTAAECGNLAVLEYFFENHPMPKKDVLNRALHAALKAGDFADVVLHLVKIGADAGSVVYQGPDRVPVKLYVLAERYDRYDSLEEIAIWGGNIDSARNIKKQQAIYEEMARNLPGECPANAMDRAISAMELILLRKEAHETGSKAIKTGMSAVIAAEHFPSLAALYAGGIERRSIFYPRVDFLIPGISKIIIMAFEQHKLRFAREVCLRENNRGALPWMTDAVIDQTNLTKEQKDFCRFVESDIQPLVAYRPPYQGTRYGGPK